MPPIQREPWSQEEITRLEGLGFTRPVIDLLHNVGFSIPVIGLLREVGFLPSTIERVAGWQPFVDMIEEFVTHYDENHHAADKAIRQGSSGRLALIKDTLLIDHYITIPIDNTDNGQYQAVYSLAHELTHALSKVNIDWSSAVGFAHSINVMEGEAYYNTMMAISNIYGHSDYASALREDNSLLPIDIDLFQKIHKIAFGSDVCSGASCQCKINQRALNEQVMLEKRGEIALTCMDIALREQSDFGASGVGLTYDEKYKWNWLKGETDIAFDYLEAFDEGRFCIYPRGTKDGRAAARLEIEASPDHMTNLRVLLNKAHEAITGNHYFGTDANDPLEAESNGSVLGLAGGYEVLWGGKGNDELHGSAKQDILLGGDDNDVLYGHDGDDRLAGNIGLDHLYGGNGNDHLYGGEGGDHLYGGNGNDHLYGGEGGDHLYGDGGRSPDGTSYYGCFNPGDDWLYGDGGDDWLDGGGGANTLEGGVGRDTYVVSNREAFYGGDTIYDSDGQGEVYLKIPRTHFNDKNVLSGEPSDFFLLQGSGLAVPELGPGYYRDTQHANVAYRFIPGAEGSTVGLLRILYNGTCVATIKDFNKTTKTLGITLADQAEAITPPLVDLSDNTRKLVRIRQHSSPDEHSPGVKVVTGKNYDTIFGSSGSEIIDSGGGRDYVEAMGGKDTVYGGGGDDYLVGDFMNNTDPGDDDYLVGGAGRDILIGCGGNDILITADNPAGDGTDEANGPQYPHGRRLSPLWPTSTTHNCSKQPPAAVFPPEPLKMPCENLSFPYPYYNTDELHKKDLFSCRVNAKKEGLRPSSSEPVGAAQAINAA